MMYEEEKINDMDINDMSIDYENWRMYQAWLEYVVYDNGDE